MQRHNKRGTAAAVAGKDLRDMATFYIKKGDAAPPAATASCMAPERLTQ
jgi:hypothetical protein